MKKLIIANWKSNKNSAEVASWLDKFSQSSYTQQILIAPSFPLLSQAQTAISSLQNVSLAAQDISPFPAGSYTGAVSVRNLEGLGVTHVILGHSERRQHFGETHQEVANKVSLALSAGIQPIVCLDEEYISEQAAAIDSTQLQKCVAVYEPLSAIGSGESAEPAAAAKIKDRIVSIFGEVPVLYGGSVGPENAAEFHQYFDGVVVGTNSLSADVFMELIHNS